jgi:rRNA maturation RNase YbeY
MNKKKSQVQFHFHSPCSLPNRRKLKLFIHSLFKKEKLPFSLITIIFCDDKYLLELNMQFLKHDFYTDILSFPLSAKGEPVIGEIYISVDRVRDNAKNLGASFREELHRVIFHGILHFCGYKDKSSADIILMRSREDKCLNTYFRKK